eukprot:5925-Heterococcus_DN1.PRE.2
MPDKDGDGATRCCKAPAVVSKCYTGSAVWLWCSTSRHGQQTDNTPHSSVDLTFSPEADGYRGSCECPHVLSH